MERKHFKRDIRRVGEVLLLFVFLQVVIGFGSSLLLRLILNDVSFVDSRGDLMGVIELLSTLIPGVVCWLYGTNRLHIQIRNYIKPFPRTAVLNGISATFFLVMVTNIIMLCLQLVWTKLTGFTFYQPDFTLSDSWIYNIALLISSIVIAPIFEEILCRGIVLRAIAPYNKTLAIICSGVFFGMLHMNVEQCVPTMLLGMVFAYVSLKYNSILLPMTLHFINNLFAMLALNIPFLQMGLSMMELAIAFFGSRVVACEWPRIKEQWQSYPYAKDTFKQWTILLFIAIFLLLGISSLFGM